MHTVRRSATVFICPAMGVKVATPWKDEAIKASTNRGCLWWVVAGIVALAVWAGISTASDEGAPDDLGARVACRLEVERQLKSPSSAEFSGERVTNTGNTYTVTGSVDSQNSFGAMVRAPYTCTATWIGPEDYDWRATASVIE